jgi:hypothetical protein
MSHEPGASTALDLRAGAAAAAAAAASVRSCSASCALVMSSSIRRRSSRTLSPESESTGMHLKTLETHGPSAASAPRKRASMSSLVHASACVPTSTSGQPALKATTDSASDLISSTSSRRRSHTSSAMQARVKNTVCRSSATWRPVKSMSVVATSFLFLPRSGSATACGMRSVDSSFIASVNDTDDVVGGDAAAAASGRSLERESVLKSLRLITMGDERVGLDAETFCDDGERLSERSSSAPLELLRTALAALGSAASIAARLPALPTSMRRSRAPSGERAATSDVLPAVARTDDDDAHGRQLGAARDGGAQERRERLVGVAGAGAHGLQARPEQRVVVAAQVGELVGVAERRGQADELVARDVERFERRQRADPAGDFGERAVGECEGAHARPRVWRHALGQAHELVARERELEQRVEAQQRDRKGSEEVVREVELRQLRH